MLTTHCLPGLLAAPLVSRTNYTGLYTAPLVSTNYTGLYRAPLYREFQRVYIWVATGRPLSICRLVRTMVIRVQPPARPYQADHRTLFKTCSRFQRTSSDPEEIYCTAMIYLSGTGFNSVSHHLILCEPNLIKFHAKL